MKETTAVQPVQPSRAGGAYVAPKAVVGGPQQTRGRFSRRGFSFLRTQWKRLLLIAFVLLVLTVFQAVLTPFIISFAAAYVLYPAVLRLTRLHIGSLRLPVWTSILVVYFVLIGGSAMLISLTGPPVAGQLQKLIENIPSYMTKADAASDRLISELEIVLQAWETKVAEKNQEAEEEADGVSPGDSSALATPVEEPPPVEGSAAAIKTGKDHPPDSANGVKVAPGSEELIKTLRDKKGNFLNSATQGLQYLGATMPAFIEGLVRSIFNFFLVLMLTFLFLLHFPKIYSFARSLVPRQYQPEFESIAEEINDRLAGVVRGQLTICLVNGVLTYVGFALIGVRFASLLAVVAGVLSLIPIFGTIISTIPAVLLALTQSFTIALLALGWVVIIHIIEAYVLNPLIMGDAAHMNPLLIVFALLVGSQYFHPILGPLLAAPIAAIIQTVFLHFLTGGEESAETSPEAPTAAT